MENEELYEQLYLLTRCGIEAAIKILEEDTGCSRVSGKRKLEFVLKLAASAGKAGVVTDYDFLNASVLPISINDVKLYTP